MVLVYSPPHIHFRNDWIGHFKYGIMFGFSLLAMHNMTNIFIDIPFFFYLCTAIYSANLFAYPYGMCHLYPFVGNSESLQ